MTSKAVFELTAELRKDTGKGASRRLRRIHDIVPAIVFGGKEKPASIQLDHKKLMHALEHQAFYSHLLTLHIDSKKETVILKDVQRHPFKKAVLHLDFQRVSATDKIHMKVPIRYIGADVCPGVKEGGIVNHKLIDIEIKCLASALPEFIEVDISNLGMDETIHLSQVKVPKGIEIVQLAHATPNDEAVVSVHLPRVVVEEEPTPAPAEEGEAGAAPEAAAEGGEAGAEKAEKSEKKE